MTTDFETVDSLVANEFAFEIDGEVVQGMFTVSNLVTYTSDGETFPFEVSKMVQRDPNTPFNSWHRETIDGKNPTRTVAVVAIDDGVETRRWTFSGAKIQSIRYSAFDTASNEMVAEIYTIAYDSVAESWSAS